MTNPSMKVSVETKFLPADSSEEGAIYCFSYFVTIENGTRITSPIGSMHGSYFCVTEDAKFFDVVIPPFSLKAEGLGPRRDAAAVLH